MTETAEVGTIELLSRAADAAALASRKFGRKVAVRIVPIDGQPVDDQVRLAIGHTERRYKASGPDHWQAIEALFRAMLGEHGAEGDDEYPDHGEYCRTCHPLLVLSPCPSLQVLRPLAEQVLQQLAAGTP